MRLLYIDIDTLRPDHLGCYGYGRRTSPNIDALAADGLRFEQVHASDVPCLPSRTALITGRFGIHTGVVNHGGRGADLSLAPEGAQRAFQSRLSSNSWAGRFYSEGHRTASFSSFPFRHSAPWWTVGFQQTCNAARGIGLERADEVVPEALRWLEQHAAEDKWVCHVHLWDPHTPYNTPDAYGNPFRDEPLPHWYTEEVRSSHWEWPGPHSAQEPWGFTPDEPGPPGPRQPWNLTDLTAVKMLFDGYDVGVKFADDHVGILLNKLADLGLLDDTVIMLTSDHGEALGELGVYADHQAADQATTHLPMILRGPGIPARVDSAFHYQIDVAETLLELAQNTLEAPADADAQSFGAALLAGRDQGRAFLVTSQGAWSCQRGVRFENYLYLRTWHDGYHNWPARMLFDVANDPHQQHNLAEQEPLVAATGARTLEDWTTDQLQSTPDLVDPLALVIREGGPYHVRGRLPPYLDRLRATGRGQSADALARRHL